MGMCDYLTGSVTAGRTNKQTQARQRDPYVQSCLARDTINLREMQSSHFTSSEYDIDISIVLYLYLQHTDQLN